MAFEFLANISNNVSNAVQAIGTGESTGYDPYDQTHAASGPRNEINVWEPANSSGSGLHFTYDTNEWDVDYLVIVRADYLQSVANSQYKVTQENSGGTVSDLLTWTNTSGLTLIGPRDQDAIISLSTSSGQRYGNGVAFKDSTNGSNRYNTSDLIFAKAYDIGEPSKRPLPSFSRLPEQGQEFFPYEGYYPLATEVQFSLTWPILNRSEVEIFEAFLQFGRPLRVPFFLYDPTGDLLPYNLEHCIIETYSLTFLQTADHYQLQISFRRLKHYL